MNFKNTYINVEGYSPERINKIAEKYSKASGYPLFGRLKDKANDEYEVDDIAIEVYREDIPEILLTTRPESYAKEITEQDLDNYLQQKGNVMNYPTFDFKIDLSNMSDAEKEVAKEWLKSVAESRKMGLGALESEIYENYFWVNKEHSSVTGGENYEFDFYQEDETTELFLTFSKPTITSWETPSKKSEKELQLEELVSKLQQQLKEAEQQLENLK